MSTGHTARHSAFGSRLLRFEMLEARRVLAGMFAGTGGTGLFIDTIDVADFGRLQDVALGDLDGDGDIDVVVEGANSGLATVWKNEGDGNFQAVWTGNFAGGTRSNTYHLELADLDGDGDLDIFSTGRFGGHVWKNDGTGNFSDTGQSLAGSARTSGLTVGDFDGDGDLDAIILSTASDSGLYENDGDGNFSLNTTTAFSAVSNFRIEAADLDGDGDDDVLAIKNTEVTVWQNNGAAGLAVLQTLPLPNGFRDIEFGDLDGDGDVDGVVATFSQPSALWMNDGSGQFTVSATKIKAIGEEVRLADFDGDGDLDAFAASGLLLNDGAGNFFASPHVLPAVLGKQRIADLDGDGDLDVFAVGRYGSSVWLNSDVDVAVSIESLPTSPWAAPGDALTYQVTVRNNSPWIANQFAISGFLSGPVEELTLADIVVSAGAVNSLGEGPVPADWFALLTLPGQATVVYQFTTAVLDADDPGLTLGEIVGHRLQVTSLSSQTLGLATRHEDINEKIVLNDVPQAGNHLIDTGQQLASGYTRDLALGDLDGDGDFDVFVAKGSRDNQVWVNDGAGVFSDSEQRLSTSTGPLSQFGDGSGGAVALGDLDGDGDLDAVIGVGYGTRIWVNDGTGTFSESSIRFTVAGDNFEQSGQAVLLGDVDGDGDLDIVALARSSSRQSRVWLNDGSGGFGQFREFGAPRTQSAAMADIDGDGDLDLVTSEFVLANDGTGIFTNTQQVFSRSDIVALGDFDGDGDVDLLEGDVDRRTRVVLNDGTGNFTELVTLLDDENVDLRDFQVADFDGDGDLDFFQIQQNGENRLWLNDGAAAFTESSLRFTPSAGNAGAVGDIDGDGDIDLLIGNSYGPDRVFVNASLPELVDLSVSKSPAKKSLLQGEAISYSVTVENLTRSDVVGASFVEALTPNFFGATLVSVSTEGGAVAQAVPGAFDGSFSDTLNLPALSSVTYVFSAKVIEAGSPIAAASQTATNTARVILPAGQFDPDLSNNVAEQSFVIDLATSGGTASFSNVFASADPPGSNANTIALGDLNGDGFLDAVIGVQSGNTTFPNQRDQVWLGNGDGTFQVGAQLLSQADGTLDVVLGDLDGDGDLDAVFLTRQNPGNTRLIAGRIWLNDGEGLLVDSGQILQARRSFSENFTEPSAVIAGDLDGDGDLDLLFVGRSDSTTAWWNDGTGQFTDSGQRLSVDGTSIDLGDVDGDGDLDALVSDVLLINDGQGIFELTRPGFGSSYGSGNSFLRDLDGDGDLDAAIITGGGPRRTEIWLNDGSGVFTDTEQEFEPFNLADAGIADFDNDGDLDFIAAVRGGDSLANRVWLNDGAANFELSDIGYGDDETRFLAVGDLNNDGAVDYFELNSGNDAQHRVWLNASTDLSIDIAEDPARTSVVEGSTVRYTVTAANLGASVAGPSHQKSGK